MFIFKPELCRALSCQFGKLPFVFFTRWPSAPASNTNLLEDWWHRCDFVLVFCIDVYCRQVTWLRLANSLPVFIILRLLFHVFITASHLRRHNGTLMQCWHSGPTKVHLVVFNVHKGLLSSICTLVDHKWPPPSSIVTSWLWTVPPPPPTQRQPVFAIWVFVTLSSHLSSPVPLSSRRLK